MEPGLPVVQFDLQDLRRAPVLGMLRYGGTGTVSSLDHLLVGLLLITAIINERWQLRTFIKMEKRGLSITGGNWNEKVLWYCVVCFTL